MFRRLLSGAGLALGLFHVWLFARQASAGLLASPETLLKWLAAAGIIAAFALLHRQGISLVRGRQAVAVWTLTALLHAPAVGARLDALEIPAIPEAAISLTELTAAALSLGVLLLLWIARPRSAQAPRTPRALAPVIASAACRQRAGLSFAPRPPPSA